EEAFLEIDGRLDGVANLQFPPLYHRMVADRGAPVLRVGHTHTRPIGDQISRIADLPAGFGVKWRWIENDLTLLTLLKELGFLPSLEDRANAARGRRVVAVADEGSLSLDNRFGNLFAHFSFMVVLPRPVTLLFQSAIKAFLVHLETDLLGEIFNDLERQAA